MDVEYRINKQMIFNNVSAVLFLKKLCRSLWKQNLSSYWRCSKVYWKLCAIPYKCELIFMRVQYNFFLNPFYASTNFGMLISLLANILSFCPHLYWFELLSTLYPVLRHIFLKTWTSTFKNHNFSQLAGGQVGSKLAFLIWLGDVT